MHLLYILKTITTCRKNGCRKRLSINNSETLCLNLSTLLRSTMYLFTTGLLPALFSCSTPLPEVCSSVTVSAIASMEGQRIHTLDIFTFNDDRLMRLDSYQRIEEPDPERIDIRSQNGNKHIIICANAHNDSNGWADINSVQSIEGRYAELTSERRDCLLMTGRCSTAAGTGEIQTMTLRPLVSEITLRSIRCDFTGKPYDGKEITDVSVYLTNVNARCLLLAEGDIRPTGIINSGELDRGQVMCLAEPDMLLRSLNVPVGKATYTPCISLLCYPNSSSEESPGTPYTRLVIEGTLDGERLMWPIDVNHGEGTVNPGIHRNCSYVHDVVITRKGVSDLDEVISSDIMKVCMEVMKWEEKEGYSIEF